MKEYLGVVFDLDGVLVDTAELHFLAWDRIASELNVPFDRIVNERMKGVDRMSSLAVLLEQSTGEFAHASKHALANRKNGYYQDAIASADHRMILPGALAALKSVRAAGLKIALASASKNAMALIEQIGLADHFDFVADANSVEHHKPNPEIFLMAAEGMGLAPYRCVGVEDSVAGLQAIKSAGMYAVGVGVGVGEDRDLNIADLVLASLRNFDISSILCSPEPT